MNNQNQPFELIQNQELSRIDDCKFIIAMGVGRWK